MRCLEKAYTFIVLQVCLGKGNGGDQGAIYVKVGEQKTVLGYLSSEKMLQMPLD